MTKQRKWVAALGVVCALQANGAHALELLTNGSFETGSLSGWGAGELITLGICPSIGRDWTVSSSGAATGCTPAANPIDGVYAAYVMNDGVGGTNYTLHQSFVVPDDIETATLSWLDSSVSSYSGAPRSLTVSLSGGPEFMTNVYNYLVPFADNSPGWDARSFDISALLAGHEGDVLQLRFQNFIPQSWTGPAGFGLDRVSLAVTIAAVPEPGTLALLGLSVAGLAWTRRRSGEVGIA